MHHSHYRIFISHSWDKRDAYEQLRQILNKQIPNWRDQSVPRDARFDKMEADELKAKLSEFIKGSDVVVSFTYPIAYHSDWLRMELMTAQELGIPIVAVRPADNQRPARIVTDVAKAECAEEDIGDAIDRVVKASRARI